MGPYQYGWHRRRTPDPGIAGQPSIDMEEELVDKK